MFSSLGKGWGLGGVGVGLGKTTKEFPLSAEAIMASFFLSLYFIDFKILASVCVLLCGEDLWSFSMRLATCFL